MNITYSVKPTWKKRDWGRAPIRTYRGLSLAKAVALCTKLNTRPNPGLTAIKSGLKYVVAPESAA